MNIVPHFLFRKDFRDKYSEILLRGNDCTSNCEINYSSNKKDLKTFIKLCIVTTEKGNADYRLRLRLILEDNEIVEEILNPFPQFTYKSFAPPFIQIRTNERQLLLKTKKPFPYKLLQKSDNTLLIDFIIDSPCLHP